MGIGANLIHTARQCCTIPAKTPVSRRLLFRSSQGRCASVQISRQPALFKIRDSSQFAALNTRQTREHLIAESSHLRPTESLLAVVKCPFRSAFKTADLARQ